MKQIKYWIIGIILITTCIIYNNTFTKNILNDNQINELELEYNIKFDDIEWRLTEYKQNNFIGSKKTIIKAKNFRVNTIFPSSNKYVTVTIFKENVKYPLTKNDDKVMIEENHFINQIDCKVEVIYSNRHKLDNDNYNPIYRFSFTFNDFIYVFEFDNGEGNHQSYSIHDSIIKQDEVLLYINCIKKMLIF